MFKRLLLPLSIAAPVVAFVPDDVFSLIKILSDDKKELNVLLVKVISLLVLTLVVFGIICLYRKIRTKATIKGRTFNIVIEYGDLFAMPGKKLVNFDECFTTDIGPGKPQIKEGSVCGQYLKKHPEVNAGKIQALINQHSLEPFRGKSKFNGQVRYESGSILPNDDYLLMAFAKLDSTGKGILTIEEYQDCLSKMWKEINAYSGYENVYIPLLGSGITKIGDNNLSAEELLNQIIDSYKATCFKIKLPYELHIVCRKADVSLAKV